MASTLDHTSVRYHLSYPRQAAVFSWPECACLARSLGYRDASLELCYRQAIDAKHQAEGFQLSQLDACLGSKFFKSGFDFSYNSHSCEWNEQVTRRAFAVLAGRGMTFQQLHTTRVAYGLYESSDLRGLKAKPRTVMRALKACGRAISLGKMAHRVRHMRFHEPGRLQLDKFIDLALWAGPLESEEVRSALPAATSALPDPETRLHQLVSFEDLLTPLDGRIQRRLDAEYRREERQYVREKVRSTEPRLRQCSVLGYRQARLARSRETRAAFEPLRRALRDGAGSGGSRPATAAAGGGASTGEGRCWSDWTDEEEAEKAAEAAAQDQRKPRPATAVVSARSSPTPLVTPFDLERTELLRDALAFQTDALPEFHARWTAENLQTLRPGFHRRHAQRAAAAAREAEAARRAAEAERRASQAAATRRVRAERRQRLQRRFVELADRMEPSPLPSHGRVCDAAERGVGSAASFRRPASTTSTNRRTGGGRQRPEGVRGDSTTAVEKEEAEFWFEPQLGLSLPLTAPWASRPTLSRLGYARSCPPGVHAVTGADTAGSREGGHEEREISELIQRVVYA